MKYPTYNKQKIDNINRKKFDLIYKEMMAQIQFDNQENKMGLSEADIELLAWNSATRVLIL